MNNMSAVDSVVSLIFLFVLTESVTEVHLAGPRSLHHNFYHPSSHHRPLYPPYNHLPNYPLSRQIRYSYPPNHHFSPNPPNYHFSPNPPISLHINPNPHQLQPPNLHEQLFAFNGKVLPLESLRIRRQLAALQNIHSEFHDINAPPRSTSSTQESHEYSYEGSSGPENWPKMFNSCAGEYQSPIAIVQSDTVNKKYRQFLLENYDVLPGSAIITNNGHSVQVTLPHGATVEGGDLPGVYELMNFHFHWGSNSSLGSEHIVEGIHYPLELHMVNWNYNYLSSEEAMNHTDGVAVFAVLFHVEPIDNQRLEPIIEALGTVIKSGSTKEMRPNFRLFDLLPSDTQVYYRYLGSLTTPECLQLVIWTVFANTLPISERQLNVFREVLDKENKARENNHRPVQPLNHRTVYRSF